MNVAYSASMRIALLSPLLFTAMLGIGVRPAAAEPAVQPGPGVAAAPQLAAPNPPSPALVPLPQADAVLVRKSEHRLYLMSHGQVLRSYHVALGLVPEGAKEQVGDFRTPEGRYWLTRRNSHSDFFLSILISYPNDQDRRQARRHHVDPGGSVMLHGLPNLLRHPPEYYEQFDWTDGCIALSNSDIVDIWMLTGDNTPIDILP